MFLFLITQPGPVPIFFVLENLSDANDLLQIITDGEALLKVVIGLIV